MDKKSIIAEGKTTNEAIENGLKQLNVSKNNVDIKVLENEDKRSFFSILAPRVVKVQLTIKEKNNQVENKVIEKKIIELSKEEQDIAEKNLKEFLDEFLGKVQEGANYSIEKSSTYINVSIFNENLGFLIGYRGETLYAFQTILSAIASKGINNRVRVILDIEGYKDKREKALQNLAQNLAKTVKRTRKSVTLEPMQAYERKVIHTELQNNKYVETKSIGEEPRRKVVIELKRK